MAERSDSTFNAIEQEAIVLLAVWGMIGEMVNYLLFVKGDTTEDVQLRFNSTVHQRLFSILLVDFLSRPTPSRSNGKIGRASCREKCVSTCRSRWSPYH